MIKPGLKTAWLCAGILLMSILVPGATLGQEEPPESMTLPEAIMARNDSLVSALIDQGVGLETTIAEYYGATPLMLAVEQDDVALLSRLLEAGANPDTRDLNGDTALNWAAYYGNMENARALVEAGANPSIEGHGNALDIAMRRGHQELARWLADRMGAGQMGRSPLHRAARLGNTDEAVALLKSGIAVDGTDRIGMTALMFAARDTQSAMVEWLLKHGAEVQRRAFPRANRLTSLHFAAIGGNLKIIDQLVTAGADLDDRDSDGVTPMLWAFSEYHMDAVVRLIELGADPSIANNDGQSVTELAQRYEIRPVLEALEKKK